MSAFDITPRKNISVLLPTRGRADVAFRSLQGMAELADHPEKIEFLVAIDDDDSESAEYFTEHMIPWFEEHDIDCTVYQTPRWGYLQLHQYNNFLGSKCSGAWIVFWNDDAVMQSHGWDSDIMKNTGQFAIQAFDTHDKHPYSIFPIIPRDWLILFERLSAHQQTDAWVSQIAWMADCMIRLDTQVLHDRADLTGNNDDATYRAREYREGNRNDPMDINHIDNMNLKQHWTAKVVWMRKLLGQDTGWWDQIMTGKVDPWERMLEFDVNNHMQVTKIPLEQLEKAQ